MVSGDNGRKAALTGNTDLLSSHFVISHSQIASKVRRPLTLDRLLLISDL